MFDTSLQTILSILAEELLKPIFEFSIYKFEDFRFMEL